MVYIQDGVYTGWFSKNKPNGYGTFTYYNNGEMYKFEGNWKSGKLVGNASETLKTTLNVNYICKGTFNGFTFCKGTEIVYVDGKKFKVITGWFSEILKHGYCSTNVYNDDGSVYFTFDGNYKYGEKIISLSDYYSIQDGMNSLQVSYILGSDGTEVSSSNYDDYTSSICEWKPTEDSYISIMFENDKVASKSQFGLKY